MSEDGTALVVAAKHLTETSAGDGQLHITFDVGILGTAIHLVRRVLVTRHTAHDHNQVALNVGILTGTVKFANT